MATEIDADTELLDNKVLILADKVDNEPICTGVVEKLANTITGDSSILRLVMDIFGPPGGGDPPSPAPIIGKKHAHVVFKIETAQEVKIDGEDYFLVDGHDVFGILPVPYDERRY